MRHALIALVVLCFCATMAQSASNRTVTVTEKDSKVSLKVGDALLVRLESNPTTGYGWQVASCDKKLLKQMGEPVMEPPAETMPGAGGHQVFRFKALAAGTTTLELHYVRPWEKDKPPAQVFKIKATITKPPKAPRK